MIQKLASPGFYISTNAKNLESTRAIYTLKISQPKQGSKPDQLDEDECDAAAADMSHGEWGERCNLPAISAPLTPVLRTDRPLLSLYVRP